MGSICLYFTFPRTSSMSIINWVCSILTVVSFASILIDKKKTSVCCWWINYELFENKVKAVDVFKDFILWFNRDKLVCYDYFLQWSLNHLLLSCRYINTAKTDLWGEIFATMRLSHTSWINLAVYSISLFHSLHFKINYWYSFTNWTYSNSVHLISFIAVCCIFTV